MPSPGVEWREPLHYFWVFIRYEIVHVDGTVMAIRYVIAVDIVVTNQGRVSIHYAFHGVSKVSGQRRYVIAITAVTIVELLWDLDLDKSG